MKNNAVMSFEIFPPKKTSSIDTVYKAIDGLSDLAPDFISVTYGAGGSLNGVSTVDIASRIKNKYGIESAAHLTGVYLTKSEADEILENLKKNNISKILVLRGDINPEFEPAGDFKYASDLAQYIKQKEGDNFELFGGCYPETHPEAENDRADIESLKIKTDSGVEHLITQLFFDNQFFYDFIERAESAGINVPIEAGIMPVTNAAQIQRMVSLCGASLPPKFAKMMAKYSDNPEAVRDAGIAYAIDQIADLLSNGVYGIHLYTMNNPEVAHRIVSAVKSML